MALRVRVRVPHAPPSGVSCVDGHVRSCQRSTQYPARSLNSLSKRRPVDAYRPSADNEILNPGVCELREQIDQVGVEVHRALEGTRSPG